MPQIKLHTNKIDIWGKYAKKKARKKKKTPAMKPMTIPGITLGLNGREKNERHGLKKSQVAGGGNYK